MRTVATARKMGTWTKLQIVAVTTVTRKTSVVSHRCFRSTRT